MTNIFIALIIGFGLGFIIKQYLDQTKQEDIEENIKQWLIYAVQETEEWFDTEDGKFKLHSTYDDFIKKFPQAATIITFERFSQLVDLALEEVKKGI